MIEKTQAPRPAPASATPDFSVVVPVFDEGGAILDPAIEEALKSYVAGFGGFVREVKAGRG